MESWRLIFWKKMIFLLGTMLSRSTVFVLVLAVLERHSSESASLPSLPRLPDVAGQNLQLDASPDSRTFNEIAVETPGSTPPVFFLGNIVAKHRVVNFQPTITEDSSRGRQQSPDVPPRDGFANDLFGEGESFSREVHEDRTALGSSRMKRSAGYNNQDVGHFPSALINYPNPHFASLNSNLPPATSYSYNPPPPSNSYLPPPPSNSYFFPPPSNSYLPPTLPNSYSDSRFPAPAPPHPSPDSGSFDLSPTPQGAGGGFYGGDLPSNFGVSHTPNAG